MSAASGSPNTNGDNTNALAIAKLNTLNGYSNTYDALVAQVGVDVQAAKTTVSQDDAFTKQLTTLRDSNSGVSLDEELVALIQYQKSYQASAKLITTAGDMMDTVINMIK
jgi:flagellar hook-associated protein 1 FlgK